MPRSVNPSSHRSIHPAGKHTAPLIYPASPSYLFMFVKITMFYYYANRLFVGHNFTQTREILIRFLGICLHFVSCRETLNINKRPTRARERNFFIIYIYFFFQFPASLLHIHNARVSTYIGRVGNLNVPRKPNLFIRA